MKKLLNFTLFVLSCAVLCAQSDRGIVTGTVSDATGALMPGVQIVLANANTGAKTDTITTGTGNYTLLALPVGSYTLTVQQAGFSKYEQTNIQVQVAVTTRVDVELKIGAASDSVQVTAESTLLKTESAEQSTTVTGKEIAELPINFGIGAGAIRNPLSFIQMTPGATFNGWNNISINGGSNNFKIIFEGQESDSAFQTQVSDEEQPSVEAIEQFTLQTSNFSAEYGLVGNGGIYNFTSKSGTNQLHGSAYDYFENTFLNAGIPFTDDGTGKHTKVVKHLSDGGGSIGGPVWIPKVYNGRNKTFFFFNLEKYRDRENLYAGTTTVPNNEYLAGNLSNNLAVTANRNLGTDFAGRPIVQNAIYDPATATIDSSGRRVLNPFPGNIIPQSRFDPTAVKMLATLPKPNIGNDLYVNNFSQSGAFFKLQQIPSIKIDQNFGDRIKLSGYFAIEDTDKSNGVDGLPAALSRVRLQYIRSKTTRVNYDQTLTPTLLFHVGAGFIRHVNPDTVPVASFGFDLSTLGISGAPGTGYPRINSIGDSVLGGLAVGIGPTNRSLNIDQKPTATSSLSWVHGNHTWKTGLDWKIDTQTSESTLGLSPAYSFSSSETSQPLYGQTLPSGTGTGSAWASFLLGQYDSVAVGNAVAPQYRRTSWALFAQDTWKVTRKLTLDYGLRWDLQQPLREIHDREASFSPTTPNPNANGLPGAVIYAGSGTGRCNCQFASAYPYAIAPRLGVAYQFDAKTVFRGGWGLSYGSLAPTASQPSTSGLGFNTVTVPGPGNGVPAGILSQPLSFNQTALYGATYDPGLFVVPGTAVQGAPALVDHNAGRPPRINQWNISIQREILKDVVVEASFLGNHAVWLNAGAGGSYAYSVGNLINYDAVDPAVLQKAGLGDLTSAANRTLLSSTITSAVAVAAGFKKPYAGFPDSGTVLQSLRPFPQFSGIGQLWAPLGSTWYDALQVKVTKRFSHGLSATGAYAFSKTLDSTTNAGSIYDRGSFKGLAVNDIPNIFSLSVDYTVPVFGYAKRNRYANMILGDWRLGTIDTWQSGALLGAPGSNNAIGNYVSTGYTRQVRVPGVPLYLKDPNCGCIDPTQQTILNPAAWQDQAAGVPGSNIVYYNDFRAQRRPIVSGSLGKIFKIRESMSFSIRAEFFNLLNQNLSIANPSTSSPATPPTRSNGLLTGGFGFLNYTGIVSNSVNSSLPTPRTGQLVARFQF
jgi:hypothetical protein